MALQKVWLKKYEKHVPEHLPYPDTIMPRLLTETAQKLPGREAIIFKGTRITNRELEAAVDQITTALQTLGVVKGTRVAVHLPNCPQYVIAYYATLRAGGIVVPCNPIYQSHEMIHQLNDSGAEILFTLSNTYPLIQKIRPETKLKTVIVAEIKTYFPPVLRILFSLLLEKKRGHKTSINGDPNTLWYRDLIAKTWSKPRLVEISPSDTAVLMYTGGTTGISKGAQLTHRNILVNAFQCKYWLNSQPGVEIAMTQVPLFHSYGMTTCMNFGILNANTMVIVPDPRDLKDIVETIHKYRPTIYPGVPAMYNAINNFPDLNKYDVTSIKACISGAAGLPVEVQQQFEKITGGHLVEGYGLSECSPVTHANPVFGDNHVGTIGLPFPDTEVKIVDVDTGEIELGVGERGELCVRGPQVMKGYWNMPSETANVLREGPEGGAAWLHTGDVATMDEEGYFRIVDRKKDMILGAGGFNIYPREIEDALYQHPKVLEAAALGIPVPGKGERIKVFIVLKEGETCTEEEILDFCRQNLAAYKVPKFVEFRESLPKTLVGKILRRELMKDEIERSAPPEPEKA